MQVSAKLLGNGKQSLHAAPHVIAGSTTSSYSGRFARYLLQPRATLSRSVRWVRNETIRRSFSTTRNSSPHQESSTSPKDLPLYRSCLTSLSVYRRTECSRYRQTASCMDTNADKMVSSSTSSGCSVTRGTAVPT